MTSVTSASGKGGRQRSGAWADRLFGDLTNASPRKLALRVALVYLGLSIAYILVSSLVTAQISLTINQLMVFEMSKGILFMIGMALLIYYGLRAALGRIQEQREELRNQSAAIVIAQKQASAGLLASSLGHDVNNIVQILNGALEHLRESPRLEADEQEILDGLQDSAEHLGEMARRLTENARERVPVHGQEVDVPAVATDVTKMLERHKNLRKIEVQMRIPKGVMLRVNRVALEQSLINLLLNSAEALEGQGRVELVLTSPPGSSEVILEVHDNGPGVPKELREEIFTSLYTTKKEGAGLGLLSVKACAEMHGGRVEVDDSDLGGACFRLCFPENLRVHDKIPA